MNFAIRKDDLEIRTASMSLAFGGSTIVEIVKWTKKDDGQEYCHVLAFWEKHKERYDLRFVGNRPFSVGKKKFMKLAKIGQEELEKLGKN
jgi:hypothetical protein